MIVPNMELVKEWVEAWRGKHMVLPLPSTFDHYWANVDKDVRTQCAKARRHGYTVSKVTEAAQEDIGSIWDSWEEKQDRPLNTEFIHIDPRIPPQDVSGYWPFNYYEHTRGYLDLFQVADKEGLVVGYLELATANGHSIVYSTMGHKDYLRYGIMKLLFVEAIRSLIAQGGHSLYYLKPKYALEHPEKAVFIHDLRFIPPNEV